MILFLYDLESKDAGFSTIEIFSQKMSWGVKIESGNVQRSPSLFLGPITEKVGPKYLYVIYLYDSVEVYLFCYP